MVKLGDKVRDTVTGLEGIVMCRAEWLYDCVRIIVQPQTLHDGRPVENVQFDEGQLEVVSSGEIKPFEKKDKKTGGDRSATPSRPSSNR